LSLLFGTGTLRPGLLECPYRVSVTIEVGEADSCLSGGGEIGESGKSFEISLEICPGEGLPETESIKSQSISAFLPFIVLVVDGSLRITAMLLEVSLMS